MTLTFLGVLWGVGESRCMERVCVDTMVHLPFTKHSLRTYPMPGTLLGVGLQPRTAQTDCRAGEGGVACAGQRGDIAGETLSSKLRKSLEPRPGGSVGWSVVPYTTKKFVGSIPGQSTCLGCKLDPQWGANRRQPIDVSLLHPCFSLSLNQ